MEKRLDQIEQEQRTIKDRLNTLEKSQQSDSFLLRDIAHKETMALGVAMTTSEELRDFKLSMQERLSRLDDRVSSAHQELAELRLSVKRIEDTHGNLLNQHTELLKQILERLK
jgi:soluble cytochrome b562